MPSRSSYTPIVDLQTMKGQKSIFRTNNVFSKIFNTDFLHIIYDIIRNSLFFFHFHTISTKSFAKKRFIYNFCRTLSIAYSFSYCYQLVHFLKALTFINSGLY